MSDNIRNELLQEVSHNARQNIAAIDEIVNVFVKEFPNYGIAYYERMTTIQYRLGQVIQIILNNIMDPLFENISIAYRINEKLLKNLNELDDNKKLVYTTIEGKDVNQLDVELKFNGAMRFLQDSIDKNLLDLESCQKIIQSDNFSNIIKNAEEKVQNLEAAKRAFEGEHTKTVYTEAFEKYSDLAKRYERAFYALIYLSIMSTFIACAIVYRRSDLLYDVLIVKAVIAVAVITLLTLWIRRASHYRKLAEQAEQTALELRAIPSFLKEVREEDQRLIYRDLAGKYFGKTLDQTQHDKIGDLMQDQIKNTIELTKATVDAAKGYKDIVSAKDKNAAE